MTDHLTGPDLDKLRLAASGVALAGMLPHQAVDAIIGALDNAGYLGPVAALRAELDEARAELDRRLTSDRDTFVREFAEAGIALVESHRSVATKEGQAIIAFLRGALSGAEFVEAVEKIAPPLTIPDDPDDVTRCELSEHRTEIALRGKCTRPAVGGVFNEKTGHDIPACRSCGDSLDAGMKRAGWRFELDEIDV